MKFTIPVFVLIAVTLISCTHHPAPETSNPDSITYDTRLAEELGADDYGMRSYVFVILKTGPNDSTITDENKRKELFAGHFSNMSRLAEEGKLVLAGPLDGKLSRRGIFIFNVATVAEAEELVKTDPAIAAGIFEIDAHKYYGSAALMKINELHKRIQKISIE